MIISEQNVARARGGAGEAGLEVETLASLTKFVSTHGARIRAIAYRLGVAHEDVVAQTHLAWLEAQSHFQREHHSGAKLSTYIFRSVEQALSHATTAPAHWISIDAGGIAADEDLDHGAVRVDESLAIYEIANERDTLFGHHLSAELDKHVTQLYADLVFNDAIRGHPVYAHAAYRRLIDGILAQESKTQIAARLDRSVRRVEQMIVEVYNIIRRGDPMLDDDLINLDDDESRESDPVRYRRLDALHFEEHGLDSERLFQTAVSLLKHGVVRPIVIDQFLRVLIGDYECCAARWIGLKFVKTMVYPLAAGAHAQDKEAFARTKRSLGGGPASDAYGVDLYLTLARKLTNGTLSTLVATRLAFLPQKIQCALTTQLGALVPFLSTTDAHQIVRAHEAGEFDQVVQTLRTSLIQRIGEALNQVDSGEA